MFTARRVNGGKCDCLLCGTLLRTGKNVSTAIVLHHPEHPCKPVVGIGCTRCRKKHGGFKQLGVAMAKRAQTEMLPDGRIVGEERALNIHGEGGNA
jgi:hypothetical protein